MILLHDVYLENFMSVRMLSIRFERDSIMAISGDNGAGKSTLIYAIACAMTNYRKENGGTFKTFVKAGTKNAKIVLNADIDGFPAHYEVVIPASESGSVQRTVTYNGKTYINSEYNQFIEEHDLNYIQSLMFIFQGNKSIVAATPGERADMLKKVFQFEFDDIVSSLKDKQSESKNLVMQNEAVIAELKNRTFPRFSFQREPSKDILDGWEAEIAEIDSKLAQIGNVDSNSITLCENSRRRVLANMDTTTRKIETSQRQIEVDTAKLESFRNELFSDDNLAELKSRMDFESDGIKGYRERLEEQQNELFELRSQLRVKMHDSSELEKQIKIALGGVCHVCGQPIDEAHREKLREQKAEIDNEITLLEESIKAIDLEDTKVKLADCEARYKKYEAKKSSNEALKITIANLESSIDSARQLCETNTDYLTSITENLKHYDEELVELEKLRPLIEQRGSLESRKTELRKLLQDGRNVIASNLEAKHANERAEKEEELRDKKVADLIDKNNSIALEIEQRKQSINIFENLFPNYITLQACKKIEDYINGIIQRLFPYMRVSLKQHRGGVNFYFTSEESPQELPVCMASGAQAKILSLAYNFAIANLYGLSCLLMDEVDSDMTPENSALVFKFIASLEDFDQIVFISHKKESRDAIKESTRDNISYYEVEHGNYTLIEG